jgi:hypothetical protein
VVKILKNKSIISEKAHKEAKQSAGKQDVEIIAKTIDMVNPYEYAKGMDYELDIIDVPATLGDLDEGNVLRAQKKVLANLTKNPLYYTEKMYGKTEFDGDETVIINKKSVDAIGKGKNAKVIREEVDTENEFDIIRGGKIIARNVKFFPNGRDYRVGNKLATLGPDDSTTKSTMGGTTDMINHIKANGGLKESYTPFSINEEQEAVLQRYAEATGISIDNLKNMVAEAKAKKAKKDYDGDGQIESSEEEYKGSRDKAIKNAMSEDVYSDGQNYIDITDLENLTPEQLNIVRQIADEWGLTQYDLENDAVLTDIEEELKIRLQAVNSTDPMNENEAFESDNEPHELHILLAQLAKSTIKLAQDLKTLEMSGVDNLPQWLQAKIIIAKSYIQGAKEYLDGEIGNEMDEAILAKTTDPAHNADAIKQINSKVPNTISRAELTKAFNAGKTVDL